tara:strand:- start:1479 stop:1817 length:339 start_codon:yes stop_codon:yes gene_type:complete
MRMNSDFFSKKLEERGVKNLHFIKTMSSEHCMIYYPEGLQRLYRFIFSSNTYKPEFDIIIGNILACIPSLRRVREVLFDRDYTPGLRSVASKQNTFCFSLILKGITNRKHTA